MKIIFVIIICLSFCSCTKYNYKTLGTKPITIISTDRIIRVKDSMSLTLTGFDLKDKNYKIKWSADFGKIKGQGATVMYYAPDMVVPERIEVVLDNKNDEKVFVSTKLLVFKQVIILKADDMQFDEKNIISPKWTSFINYIKNKGIKASIGLIGNSLEKGNQQYFDSLMSIANCGMFELWNHGYNHILDGLDPIGNSYEEFLNTSYDYQIEHLVKTQNLAKEKLNIVLHSFGAPGNAIDSNTVRAINDFKNIDIWLFGPDRQGILNLKRIAEMEFPSGNPVFSLFKEYYLPQNEYLVFQIHPNAWDDKKFSEFKEMIEFLKSKDVTFLTPFEYFRLVQ